jgi:hypothetical protein
MTYDVINTCVEFKISKPQAYGFTIYSELILSKERGKKQHCNPITIVWNSPFQPKFLKKEARAITAII